jgi:hypothetical protein
LESENDGPEIKSSNGVIVNGNDVILNGKDVIVNGNDVLLNGGEMLNGGGGKSGKSTKKTRRKRGNKTKKKNKNKKVEVHELLTKSERDFEEQMANFKIAMVMHHGVTFEEDDKNNNNIAFGENRGVTFEEEDDFPKNIGFDTIHSKGAQDVNTSEVNTSEVNTSDKQSSYSVCISGNQVPDISGMQRNQIPDIPETRQNWNSPATTQTTQNAPALCIQTMNTRGKKLVKLRPNVSRDWLDGCKTRNAKLQAELEACRTRAAKLQVELEACLERCLGEETRNVVDLAPENKNMVDDLEENFEKQLRIE